MFKASIFKISATYQGLSATKYVLDVLLQLNFKTAPATNAIYQQWFSPTWAPTTGGNTNFIWNWTNNAKTASSFDIYLNSQDVGSIPAGNSTSTLVGTKITPFGSFLHQKLSIMPTANPVDAKGYYTW